MRGFDSILVPLDFSDKRSEILELALRVRSESGRLILLHVVEWLPAVTEGAMGVYAHRQDMKTYKQQAQVRLDDLARLHAPVPIQCSVLEGKPATTILEAIAEHKPSLVVMGTHGRGKLDHLLMGSVAERVLRRAGCPVLSVPFKG